MTELFVSGIQMGESPRLHDGRFWMCDWIAGEVLAFDADGHREVVARVEGLPFSIDWLSDGQLLITTPTGVVIGPELAPYGATGRPFKEVVVSDGGGVERAIQPDGNQWSHVWPAVIARGADPDELRDFQRAGVSATRWWGRHHDAERSIERRHGVAH